MCACISIYIHCIYSMLYSFFLVAFKTRSCWIQRKSMLRACCEVEDEDPLMVQPKMGTELPEVLGCPFALGDTLVLQPEDYETAAAAIEAAIAEKEAAEQEDLQATGGWGLNDWVLIGGGVYVVMNVYFYSDVRSVCTSISGPFMFICVIYVYIFCFIYGPKPGCLQRYMYL